MRSISTSETLGLSNRKTVHLVYDIVYGTDEDYMVHLPDLREPIKTLGYNIQEYFVTPDDVQEKMKHVPRTDPDHMIFLHVDMPSNAPLGSKLLAVRYIEENFKYVAGFSSVYSENTVWKSVMNSLFEKHNVAHVSSVRVTAIEELEPGTATSDKIKSLKKPYFVKVDNGFNSLGLSNSCVQDDFDSLIMKAKEMFESYGPLMIQSFISGREFTVAVAEDRAYQPVERIFAQGMLLSPPSGTPGERMLDSSEQDLANRIQDLAFRAYKAVDGSCYGRVDLREDPRTGEIFVLEVNNTCSIRPNSYFEMSVEYCGSSLVAILKSILSKLDTSMK